MVKSQLRLVHSTYCINLVTNTAHEEAYISDSSMVEENKYVVGCGRETTERMGQGLSGEGGF